MMIKLYVVYLRTVMIAAFMYSVVSLYRKERLSLIISMSLAAFCLTMLEVLSARGIL